MKRTNQEKVREYLANEYKPNYKLETEGIWNVYGEDPNCDLGGSHIEPFLGRFEGRFIDVLEHAVTMPRFYAWGGGGKVKKHKEKRVVKIGQGGYVMDELTRQYDQKKQELEKPQQEVGELENMLQGDE
jgi:hypothetical protein